MVPQYIQGCWKLLCTKRNFMSILLLQEKIIFASCAPKRKGRRSRQPANSGSTRNVTIDHIAAQREAAKKGLNIGRIFFATSTPESTVSQTGSSANIRAVRGVEEDLVFRGRMIANDMLRFMRQLHNPSSFIQGYIAYVARFIRLTSVVSCLH